MLKKTGKHKPIVLALLAIIIATYFLNFFISRNTIILGGEYIFTFDAFGHVQNILNDPRSILAQDNTNCFDCPDFYHYSRWYSLFKIGYHSLAQILFLHPFLFLVASMVVTQLLSLYIFSRVFFSNFRWAPFFVAAFVFIFYPYKFSLLIETHDGLLYSAMLLFISALHWFFSNAYKFSFRKTLGFSLIIGLIFSTFFNINIAFLPIVIYTILIICTLHFKSIFRNKFKVFILFTLLSLIALSINYPMINSLLQLGNSRHYEGYISFDFIDSFLSGLSTAQTNPIIIFSFAILFISSFIYAPLKRKYKLSLLFVYIMIALMISGKNSLVNIYGWMFEYAPLLDSMRATYRFMFFEFVIFFTFIFLALQRLLNRKSFNILLFTIFSIIFVYLPLQHMLLHKNYFLKVSLPNDYFLAQEYLNKREESKIYFPTRTPLFHNFATDYSWGNPNYNSTILLYKNPYTSLLPIRNLIQFERFPYLLSPKYLELYYFTDLAMKPQDIIKALELRGIRYLIVDNNYKWKENYPTFDLNVLEKNAELEKKFGNITILRLKDRSNECKKGYGTVTLDYCTSYDPDVKLLNKTQTEFDLEVNPQKIGTKMITRKNSIYTKSILDPILHTALLNEKILFDKEVMQIFGNQKSVFQSNNHEKGSYNVYIPLLKYISEGKLMKDAKIIVRVEDKKVKEISPYTQKTGIYWEKVKVNVEENESIFIDISGDGYIILSEVPIIEKL